MPRAPKNSVTRVTPEYKECEVCGKEFKKNSDLNRHLKTHSDDKPCKCHYEGCSFSAVQQVGLDTHINAIHLKIKPHGCYYCDDHFSDKGARIKHMKRKHGYKPAETKPKAQPKSKENKPYSRPSKAMKRSCSPTPDFLLQNMSSSPCFSDAPVAEPSSYSSYCIPEQEFAQQQLDYSFPSSDFFTPQSQAYVPAPDYCIPEAQSYTNYTPAPAYSTPSFHSYSLASPTDTIPSAVEKSEFCWDISTLSNSASQALPYRDLYNNSIASYPQVHELQDVMEDLSLDQVQPAVQPQSAFDEEYLKAWAERSIRECFLPSAPLSSIPPPSAVDFTQRNQYIDPYLLGLSSSCY